MNLRDMEANLRKLADGIEGNRDPKPYLDALTKDLSDFFGKVSTQPLLAIVTIQAVLEKLPEDDRAAVLGYFRASGGQP